ncbi:MAG TPA: 5'-methylthioadenosine/adenosylhomocysteine nucleosidase [Lachnoclostridium sp.]|uniref:5'-methylthioadenosine/adenosylhomocysteine nucleosidase n=1 Tax=Lacrimispora sp. TaxID=2719234 RepID=UPI000ED86E28|nr:5'-methylthioadenosine/adenosylhomocysteine nucleosidase [Lacrimispora sp.]HCD42838.1 5'-methylthioadenosine/adenosylhomocysteine nucleosidase [Lachnoclostridium sp.]
MLGIIGAMDVEVAEVKKTMDNVTVETIAAMDFYRGILKGKEAVVVRSGIGKVNAAVCTQILADHYHVTAVINTGIAGSLKNEINIGDVVLSTDTVHHDMDATGFGYPAGQIPQMKEFAFRADERLRNLAEECCREVNPDIGVFTGRVVSGDQFISDRVKKQWISQTFGGFCTEMEGAAIAQAAYLNHIPFLIIRAISDKADDSANMDYSEFEEKAVKHSVNLILAIAKRYSY